MKAILEILRAVLKIWQQRQPSPVPDPVPVPDPIPTPDPVPEKKSFYRNTPDEDGLVLFDALSKKDNLKTESVSQYFGVRLFDGATMRHKASAVRYDLPTIRQGYVEFDVGGLDPHRPVSEMLFTMWDAAFAPDSQNPSLARIQKHTEASTRTKNYFRMRWLQGGQEDPASRFTNWGTGFKTIRIEWSDTKVTVSINGRSEFSFSKQGAYFPGDHMFEFGGKYRGETETGAVYRNIKIGRYESGSLPPPLPPSDKFVWEEMLGEELGYKSKMKLHKTKIFWAIDHIDVAVLWDGVRNPQKALKYNWKSYRGVSRDEVKQIIQISTALGKDIEKNFHKAKADWWEPFTPEEGRANFEYVGGEAVEGHRSLDWWHEWIKKVLFKADRAAHLNGIARISRGETEGFKF